MPDIRAYLVCNDQKITLKYEETTIGRLSSNLIAINDPTISKNHASLHFLANQNKYFLCDLNTVNGTFVNGNKLEPNKKLPLKHKDSIQFGKHVNLYNFFLSQPESERKGKINLKDYCFQLDSEEEQHGQSKIQPPVTLNKPQNIAVNKLPTPPVVKQAKKLKIPNLADYLQLEGSLLSANNSGIQIPSQQKQQQKQGKFSREGRVELSVLNNDFQASDLNQIRKQEQTRKNVFLAQQTEKRTRQEKARALQQQKIRLQIERHKQEEQLLRRQIEMETRVREQQSRMEDDKRRIEEQLLRREQQRRQRQQLAEEEQRQKERRFVQQLQEQKQNELKLIRQQQQMMRTKNETIMRDQLERKKRQLELEAQALANQYEQIYKETIRKMKNDIQKEERDIYDLEGGLERAKEEHAEMENKVQQLTEAVDFAQKQYNEVTGRNRAFILYASELQNKLDKIKANSGETTQTGKASIKLKEDINNSRKLLGMKLGEIKSLEDQISKINLSLNLDKRGGLVDMLTTILDNHKSIQLTKNSFFEYLREQQALKQLWERELQDNEHMEQHNHGLEKEIEANKKLLAANLRDYSSRLTEQRLHMLKCLHYLPEDKKRAAKYLIEEMVSMEEEVRNMVNEGQQLHTKIHQLIRSSEQAKLDNEYFSQLLFGSDSTAHHFDNMKIQINNLIEQIELYKDQMRIPKRLKVSEEIQNNQIKIYQANQKLQKLKNRWRDGLKGQKIALADKNPIVFFGDLLSKREADLQASELGITKLTQQHNNVAVQIEQLQRKKLTLSESLQSIDQLIKVLNELNSKK